MSGIRASQRFDVMSKRLGSRLREHAQETFPPDAQKGLRRFAMREAADLLRINQNTFRHHVSNLEGFPEGLLEGGNRRSFSAEDMVEAGIKPPAITVVGDVAGLDLEHTSVHEPSDH